MVFPPSVPGGSSADLDVVPTFGTSVFKTGYAQILDLAQV
jgi:hypothetical protein